MKNHYRIIESRNHYKLQVKQFPYFAWRTLLEGTDFQFISEALEYYKKTFSKGSTYNIVK